MFRLRILNVLALALMLALFNSSQQDTASTIPNRHQRAEATPATGAASATVTMLEIGNILTSPALILRDTKSGSDLLPWDLFSSPGEPISMPQLAGISNEVVRYGAEDSVNQFLYLLIDGTRTGDAIDFQQSVQVLQISAVTSQTRVIFTGSNIVALSLSPNGQQLLVLDQKSGRSPLSILCVLNTQTGSCNESKGMSVAAQVSWLDNQNFLTLFGDGLHLINTDTMEVQELTELDQWAIQAFSFVPGTHVVLFSTLPSQKDVIRSLDLDSSQIIELPYVSAINGDYFASLRVSPDGRLYSYCSRGHGCEIVEYKSGKLLARQDTALSEQWLRDSQSVIFDTVYKNNTRRIARLDLSTGGLQYLLNLSQYESVIVP